MSITLQASKEAWSRALAGMKVVKPTYKISLIWILLERLERGIGTADSLTDDASLSRAFDELLSRHDALTRPGAYVQPRMHLSVGSSPSTTDRIWQVERGKLTPLPQFQPVLATAEGRGWLRTQLIEKLEIFGHPECLRLLKALDLTGKPWQEREIRVATELYLQMLVHELRGEDYVKARFREEFRAQFPHRTASSVDFKLQNISAVLQELGCPTIRGYLPLTHVQSTLRNHVSHALQAPETIRLLEQAGNALESTLPLTPEDSEFGSLLVEPPSGADDRVFEPGSRPRLITDFTAHEARNRALGEAGERFVLEFERWRLLEARRADLAKRIEWTSRERGDGVGFDLLSFDPSTSKEKYLEVKTTSLGIRSAFFASRNEVDFSRRHANDYRLCRVFDFRAAPRMYELPGSLSETCRLETQTFICKAI